LVLGFGDPNCVPKARSRLSQPLLLQKRATKRFFIKLLKGLRYVPCVIVTDKLTMPRHAIGTQSGTDKPAKRAVRSAAIN